MTTNGSGGPSGAPGGGGSKRLAQQQAQVDEVVDIMRQNVDKVLERDKNLSLLDDRADKLQHNAAQFEQHAGKLKRKYWWKNMKMMIIMGIVGVIFAIVVIGWIASKVKSEPSAVPASGVTATVPVQKLPGVPTGAPSSGRSSTRHRGRSGKKAKLTRITTTTTTTLATVVNQGSDDAAPDDDNDDEKELNNAGEDETKAAIKRAIRALIDRQ